MKKGGVAVLYTPSIRITNAETLAIYMHNCTAFLNIHSSVTVPLIITVIRLACIMHYDVNMLFSLTRDSHLVVIVTIHYNSHQQTL